MTATSAPPAEAAIVAPTPQRDAVPRDRDQDRNRTSGRRNNGPVVVTRNRPNININIGSSYRGPRYYAPVHYDRWARQLLPLEPDRLCAVVADLRLDRIFEFRLLRRVRHRIRLLRQLRLRLRATATGLSPYSPWQRSGYDVGGVRLKIRPRDAQVFVDGYYAGLVDDFDGTFQSLRLEQGGHKIEVHMPGFEDLELDVHVQPGRTITLNEDLRPRP